MTELRDYLVSIDVQMGNEQINQLERMLDVLSEWNATHNLTRITERHDQIVYHILDALVAHEYFKPYQTILDVGTGAGFPGIPLAIYYPKKHFILLDSSQKKQAYLKALIHDLGIQNVTLINDRIENFTEHADVITSRAMADPMSMCRLTSHIQADYLLYIGQRDDSVSIGEINKLVIPSSNKQHYMLFISTKH